MKKLIIVILAVVLVGVGALFIIGQTDGRKTDGKREFGKRGMHSGFGQRGRRSHGNMMGRAFRQLDLTDAQKEQIKQIRKEGHESSKAIRHELMANRAELRKIAAGGAVNESRVETLAKKQGDLHAGMIVHKHKIQARVFAILTAQQKAKLAELKADFQKKMEDRKARWAKSNAGNSSQ